MHQMHESIICDLITPISLFPLYGVYFILIYRFNVDLIVCQSLVINEQ